jgi:hypothetical protein
MSFDHLPLAEECREQQALALFRLAMLPDEFGARFGHQFAPIVENRLLTTLFRHPDRACVGSRRASAV